MNPAEQAAEPMSLTKLMAQIAASREHLQELYRQRKALLDNRRIDRRPRNLEILRLFDDELLSSKQISQRMKISDNACRQFLHSRGRTKRGREAVLSQMKIMTETMK